MWTDAALLAAGFDELQFLRHTLHLPSVDAEQARIHRCVEAVQQDMKVLISRNVDGLMHQVDAACAAESSVATLRSAVHVLENSVKRLKHTVEEPHDDMARRVQEVRNTMEAVDVLRTLQRFMTAVQKLPELVVSDVARAARVLREVEDLVGSGRLAGIDVAEKLMDTVTKHSAATRSKAHELLRTATANQNQAEVAVALQCFFSLGTLSRVVTSVLSEHKRELTKMILKELDLQTVSSALEATVAAATGSPTPTLESQRTRDVVFGKLELVVGESLRRYDSSLLLWRILQKRRDPVTHECFLDAIKEGSALWAELWHSTAQLLSEAIVRWYKRGNLFLMLVNEIPRFEATLATFSSGSTELLRAVGDVAAARRWHASVAEDVEGRFVSQCAEKHREKVQQLTLRLASVIPSGGAETVAVDVAVDPARPQLPSMVTSLDVKGLMKVVHQDVVAFRQDSHVLSLVLRQAASSLALVAQRLQGAISKVPRPSANTVGTAAQMFHLCTINAASSIHQDISNLISVLPADASGWASVQELKATGQALRDLCRQTISPYFALLHSTLGTCVDEAVDAFSEGGLQRLTVSIGTCVSRFLLLMDRSTPTLDEQEKDLVDALLARTVVRCLLQRPLDDIVVAQCAKCLTQIPAIVSTIPHLPASSTNLWKNYAKAAKGLIQCDAPEEGLRVHLPTVPPALLLVHLVQRIPVSCFPSLAQVTGWPDDRLVNTLATVVQSDAAGEEATITVSRELFDRCSKAFVDYEGAHLEVEGAKQRRWHVGLFNELRRRAA